jgi:co-chaperonin GroES (HSP10)
MSFKVGDRVVLPQVGPTKLEWDGVEYIAVSEAQVLALIEEQN